LAKFLELYPDAQIMQADKASAKHFDKNYKFESGKSKSKLTGTNPKSWVIGVKTGKSSKAFDWNELKKHKILIDKVGNTNIFVSLSKDEKIFFAFESNSTCKPTLKNDTIIIGKNQYKINGVSINGYQNLKLIQGTQEFWHSWQEFDSKSPKK
jgi:hypothetical protein